MISDFLVSHIQTLIYELFSNIVPFSLKQIMLVSVFANVNGGSRNMLTSSVKLYLMGQSLFLVYLFELPCENMHLMTCTQSFAQRRVGSVCTFTQSDWRFVERPDPKVLGGQRRLIRLCVRRLIVVFSGRTCYKVYFSQTLLNVRTLACIV